LLTLPILDFYAHLTCFIKHIGNAADETECIFRDMIVFAVKYLPEVADSLFDWYVRPFLARELFCDVEVLGKEELDAART
jgi:hypothetical protein